MTTLSKFESLFRSPDSPRDKFLSRLFGIFSEDVVRFWCSEAQAPFEDLGRPTVKGLNGSGKRGRTFDFTFRSRTDGRIYVGEMKCELEYQGYKYLTLESPEQLEHHSLESFQIFLDLAKNPNNYLVTTNHSPQPIGGCILVWGRATAEGRGSVTERYGLNAVLTIEEVISDLLTWENKEYLEFVNTRENWSQELFSGLRDLRIG
jgi:hypothetical protein